MTEEITPHEWSIKVQSVIYVENMFLINNYKFNVGFDTSSANPILHDIAFEKISMFFEILMNNSIIISKTDFETNNFSFDNNYIELPDMLNDQTLGSAIYSKLCALVGEDLIISYVKLSSTLGKKIKYTIDVNSPELVALLPDKEVWWGEKEIKKGPWWARPDTATYDKVIDGEDIYIGEFNWNDHFEEELKEVENSNFKSAKFKIINGGKDSNENNQL